MVNIEELEDPIKKPEVKPAPPKEPVKVKLKLSLPLPLVRWLLYTPLFGLFGLPAVLSETIPISIYITGCLVCAHFSGQLNKLIDK